MKSLFFNRNMKQLGMKNNSRFSHSTRTNNFNSTIQNESVIIINVTQINILNFFGPNQKMIKDVQKILNEKHEMASDSKKLAKAYLLSQNTSLPDYINTSDISTVQFSDGGKMVSEPSIVNIDNEESQIENIDSELKTNPFRM